MNRARALHTGPLVSIARFDHPAGRRHRDPDEERASSWTFSFIQEGAFTVVRGRRRWKLAEGSLFVTRPGLFYRCEHDERVPVDVCLSVSLAAPLVEEIETRAGSPWEACVPAPGPTNRLAYLRGRLERALADGAGPMAIETLAAETAAALAGPPPPSRTLFGARQLAWYVERVDAARRLIDEDPAAPRSLGALSRQVGMSPFHFARIFHELAGAPPHRYLLRARLRRAALLLREGTGVTRACLLAGFNNLGHFSRTFHAAYGVPPSRYAR